MHPGEAARYLPAPGGRSFSGHRRVRLGDVTGEGRLRLDALTRYTQDVSDDDTTDAGLSPEPGWVVRRTRVEVLGPALLGEDLEITTFCSALGKRWAERHLRVLGSGGARYEVSTLWICIDPVTGRPRGLTGQFRDLYGPAAGGRTVGARLTHPKPPPDGPRWRWPLRAADFDVYDHVNNAAYWAVVEEVLHTDPELAPFHASIEYAAGLPRQPEATIVSGDGVAGTTRQLWWLTGEGTLAASAVVSPGIAPLPDQARG